MADGFALAEDVRPPLIFGRGDGQRPITIGLVNNMPDAALAATEAQFRRLLTSVAGDRSIRLKLFALPGVPRSDAARAAMAKRYASTQALHVSAVDALIVTGAEPVKPDLLDEPYWAELAALTDWAKANTVSTLFSCLAAHAAVLHLDGIERTPLPAKRSGIFEVQAAPHALTFGHDGPLFTPHSRWNDLDEGRLRAAGYDVLTRSDLIGVDAFLREDLGVLLFLQGHPEYDADTLMLEYRRDLRRFLLGERPKHPDMPVGYFNPAVETALRDLAARTVRAPDPQVLSECARIMRSLPPPMRWARTTERLYANWLDLIAERIGPTVGASLRA